MPVLWPRTWVYELLWEQQQQQQQQPPQQQPAARAGVPGGLVVSLVFCNFQEPFLS